MKTAMVIYEGAADLPLEELQGRTPLQVARCAHADQLAELGQSGLLLSVHEGLDARNEVTLAALLGVPAEKALHLQRGPVEALGLDEEGLERYDFAYAGNFVTLDDEMLRESCVHTLSFEETQSLANCLQDAWPSEEAAFRAVGPARVVVLCRRREANMPIGYPPCFMEGERLNGYLPRKKSGGFIKEVLRKSEDVLQGLTINDVRLDLGENPANALWLWGGGPVGKADAPFEGDRPRGVIVTESAMARGLAKLCGMRTVSLNKPWLLDDEQPAVDFDRLSSELGQDDFLMTYVETPKKQGLYGSVVEKVRALEAVDQRVLGPLMEWLGAQGDHQLLLASDGVVSTKTGCPTTDRMPFVVAGTDVKADKVKEWNEEEGAQGALGVVKVTRVLSMLGR
jgi:2,3-bisphosphoglycerate-independent phosphoglycerate mutase